MFGGLPESFSDSNSEFRDRLRVYEAVATEDNLPDFMTKIQAFNTMIPSVKT